MTFNRFIRDSLNTVSIDKKVELDLVSLLDTLWVTSETTLTSLAYKTHQMKEVVITSKMWILHLVWTETSCIE